jgi:hypothetical protein
MAFFFLPLFMLFIWGCIIEIGNPGSEEETGTTNSNMVAGTYSIRGNAMLGQIQKSNIALYEVQANGQTGNLIASGSSDFDGNFSLNIPENFHGPVIFHLSAGVYKDLSSGRIFSAGEKQIIRLYLPSLEKGQNVALTALTEIAASCIAKKTKAAGEVAVLINDINNDISQKFGIQDISKIIIDKYYPADNTGAQRTRYAYIHAGFSEFASIYGGNGTLSAVRSFSEDFADCVFDGKNETGDIFIEDTNTLLPRDAYDNKIWDAVDAFIQSGKKID